MIASVLLHIRQTVRYLFIYSFFALRLFDSTNTATTIMHAGHDYNAKSFPRPSKGGIKGPDERTKACELKASSSQKLIMVEFQAVGVREPLSSHRWCRGTTRGISFSKYLAETRHGGLSPSSGFRFVASHDLHHILSENVRSSSFVLNPQSSRSLLACTSAC